MFYVRTTVRLCDADGNLALEHDYLAVKVELARLWLLFLPTFLAVGFLVVSSAGGILWKFSLLNTIFSSEYGYIAFCILHALGRGVTDLDKQTANAQAVLAETTS